MTLVQLEYILAVAEFKNFTIAAEKSFVTQPTLSMQIQKMEKELNIEIFDRKSQPIKTTPIGQKIVDQSRIILAESKKIKQMVLEKKQNLSGEFTVGIIPTIFPTLVPLFLKNFQKKHPNTKLILKELKTSDIIAQLKSGLLDFGIAVTPLVDPQILENPLYYEPLVGFIPSENKLSQKSKIKETDLQGAEILLLEEGHCFRNNVLNICGAGYTDNPKLDLQINSFSTLVKLSKDNYGITLLPAMFVEDLNAENLKNIRHFESPEPTREVSLIYHENQIQLSFIKAISEVIKGVIRGKNYLDSSNVTSPKLTIA